MSAFAAWLMGFAKVFLNWGYNCFIDLINAFIVALCTFIGSLIGMFPSGSASLSPGSAPVSATFTAAITTLNWIFPVTYLLTCFGVLTMGMAAYFGCAVVLRWFKVLT
jgi:hypothetical protein